MASFVVMEAPAATDGDRAVVYVRDGFHFLAFLVPPLWLLWHRLWIEAALAFALMLALSALGSVAGVGGAAPTLSLLVSIYAGLEGSALRIAALRRRGWREFGVVDADNRDEAEIKHLYAGDMAGAPEPEFERPPPAAAPSFAAARLAPGGPALGLFSYPGRR
ncbi:MAG: DUF2628 domain-containing protein [Mesorhizobium sp.]|nr:DUF2628 domain-containing protein [Mesorhizobium sp.]